MSGIYEPAIGYTPHCCCRMRSASESSLDCPPRKDRTLRVNTMMRPYDCAAKTLQSRAFRSDRQGAAGSLRYTGSFERPLHSVYTCKRQNHLPIRGLSTDHGERPLRLQSSHTLQHRGSLYFGVSRRNPSSPTCYE